jgi:hypothetical protein
VRNLASWHGTSHPGRRFQCERKSHKLGYVRFRPNALTRPAGASTSCSPTHAKGELETIASGFAFGSADLDDAFVYVVTEVERARVLARLPKAGGPLTIIARDVRDAPIDVMGNEVFFFDATKRQLRAAPTAGGDSRVVAQDEAFSTPSAIEADTTTVYIAAGSRGSAAVLAVDRK